MACASTVLRRRDAQKEIAAVSLLNICGCWLQLHSDAVGSVNVLDASQIVATQESNIIGNYIIISVAALITYDYVLTLRREVKLFWGRRVNISSILFYAVRYSAIAYYVGLALFRTETLPYPECKSRYILDIALRYVGYFPWAMFSTLRVYALSLRCWPLAAFVFFWSILPIPLNYYGDFHHISSVPDPIFGCVSGTHLPSFLSLLGTAVIQGGLIIADITVIGLTWKATLNARQEGHLSPLTQVIFENGTIYFFVLLVLNVLHIIFAFLPNSALHIPTTQTSYLTKFSEPINAILVYRFLLDLHEANVESVDEYVSGIDILGSLGSISFTDGESTMDSRDETV